MLDVSRKTKTLRIATAKATVRCLSATVVRIRERTIPKGDVLEVARVAAIQAAKNTSHIIPFCHPVPVDFVGVEFELGDDTIAMICTAKAIYKTGVEMEALTAASVAALTVYDMLKMLDDSLAIESIVLVEKQGGKSDFRETFATPLRAAVLVISDSTASGRNEDTSGRLIVERLRAEGVDANDYLVVPDEPAQIVKAVRRFADELKLDLVITTGGTGCGPRDHTPEAMHEIFEREIPGIAEALRSYGQERTPRAMLARGKAGLRGRTIIVNLPGSRKAVAESLDALFPGLFHAFHMLWGGGHPSAVKS